MNADFYTARLSKRQLDELREILLNAQPDEARGNPDVTPSSHPENEPTPKGEAWRELDATDRQLELLDRMKVGYQLPLKRGEASELIDSAMRNRPRR